MPIGDQIRIARLRAGLSQSELASRSATSQATISAYENGRKQPAADTLERVLAAAGAQIQVVPRERAVELLGSDDRRVGRLAEVARTTEH